MGILTLVCISVLIPKLNVIVRFKFVIKAALVCAVPRTPSNSLLTRTLPLTLSTFKTRNLSVVMPKTSFGAIDCGDKLPVTEISVTIPVTPVVPMPVFNCKNDVLNPTRCFPSNCRKESVESPEIVTTSPTTKS